MNHCPAAIGISRLGNNGPICGKYFLWRFWMIVRLLHVAKLQPTSGRFMPGSPETKTDDRETRFLSVLDFLFLSQQSHNHVFPNRCRSACAHRFYCDVRREHQGLFQSERWMHGKHATAAQSSPGRSRIEHGESKSFESPRGIFRFQIQ